MGSQGKLAQHGTPTSAKKTSHSDSSQELNEAKLF